MKRFFLNIIFLLLTVVGQARIIYLNVEGSDWNSSTRFWVQLWQYPQERGSQQLDSRIEEMVKVVDYVYAVEVGDYEHWTNVLFSNSNISSGNWSGVTIDLDLPSFSIDDAYSKDCFYTSSPDWHSPSAWGIQSFWLKHSWNNAGWSWRQLTHNGNGTYSLTAQYSGAMGCNYATANMGNAADQPWEGTNTLSGYPAQGNTCIFTFNPLAEHKVSISRQFYLKHPWGGGGWTWSTALVDDGGQKFSIVKAWGDNGCNYNTQNNDTGSSWVASTNVETVGSPRVGDLCTFTYDCTKSATTKGVITVTKAYYMKHDWGGAGLWLWEPLTDNGDGTYSIVKRWGGTGCNWNQSGRNNGSTWVEDIVVENDDEGNAPNVGDFCRFTLNPSTGSITVKHLGHEIVDPTTWNIYFTCGYDANKKYYWDYDGSTAYAAGTGKVYAYMWRDGTSYKNAEWPGVEIKCCGQNEYGQYVYVVNKKIYDRVIFNNGKRTEEPNWRQTAEYSINATPIALYLDGWQSTEGSSYNTISEWNPTRAAEDVDDVSKHYWICKHCDRYIHESHNYAEGCLKCSRLDLNPMSVPSRLATKFNLGTYDKVNLTRTFAAASSEGYGGYGTLALPFNVADVRAIFGSDAYVASFVGAEKDAEDEYVFSFTNGTSMVANTPYIIYTPSGKANPVFENVTVVLPSSQEVNPTSSFSMLSNYTPNFSMSGKYGVAYNRVIMRGGSSSKLNAYSAYLKYNRSGVPKVVRWRDVEPDEAETNTIREVSLLISRVLSETATFEQIGKKVEKVLK